MKLRKKILSLIFLIVYSTVAFNFTIPVVTHYLFKDYIVQNVCVKREVVENKCQGNCHLKKQFSKNENTNKNDENPKAVSQFNFSSSHLLPVNSSKIFLVFNKNKYLILCLKQLIGFSSPNVPPPKIF